MKKIVLLFAIAISAVNAKAQTSIFTEDFEGATLNVTSSNTSGGSASWALNTNYQTSGTKSDSARVSLSDTLILTTNNFSTMGFTFVTLNFDHICKIDFFDKAIIQVSTNNGSSWTQLTSAEYNGTGFLNSNSFSAVSYSVWNIGNPNAIPAQAWWQSESFNLTSFANNMQVSIRFLLIDSDNNGNAGNYGWLLDDIEVIGAPCELIPPSISLTGTIYQGNVFSTGPYNIEADIQDASGIASATLEYTLNSGAINTLTMNNTSGNIYSATIPAASIDDTICYTIIATDATTCGNVARFPATCTQFIVSPNPPPRCIGTAINVFPHNETFANFTPGNSTANGPGALNNDWENETNDTHNWFVLDRNTNSNGTGPTQDHSPNDDNYVYVEATGFFNRTAILNTPCFDLTSGNVPKFRFWYHMLGANMGDLRLDIYFGGQWVLDIMPVISGDQGNNWLFREVDLAPYNGAVVKLRFRAVTGSGFQSDIAIDDIELFDAPANDISVESVVTPNALSCSGSVNEFVTVEIQNLGSVTQNSMPLAYRVNNGAVVRDTAKFSLALNATANHTFQQPFNMSNPGVYNIDVWSELVGDAERQNDSIINYTVTRSSSVTVFPDTTNFDNFIQGIPGTLLDGWENGVNDDLDWFVQSGTTPSNTTTGPSSDTIRGNNNYMYIEATNSFNLEAQLISKCYDISNLNQPELSFFYHMYGATMGTMHIDLSINGFLIPDIIPAKVGNFGNQWFNETIDLTAYKGIVKIIFRGVTGPSFRSDMAIDAVSIRDAMPVGIEEAPQLSSENELVVYPNPTSTDLRVIRNTDTPAELRVYNYSGQLLRTQTISAQEVFVPTSSLASGVYFLEILDRDGELTRKKFIKQD